MNRTAIEWTTFSANPLKYLNADGRVVWGCVHASEGCRNCYSEALGKRYGRGGPFTAQVMRGLTPFMDDGELRHMRKAQRIGGVAVSGSRCFVGDMTDLFGEWVPDELLDYLFATFAWRRDVTWQLLTKRSDRMRAYSAGMAALSPKDRTRRLVASMYRGHPAEGLVAAADADDDRVGDLEWPLRNVWLGVSVENQDQLKRIDYLKDTPAAVRFVSFEPLLEDLGALLLDGIHLAIWGGESGPRARPCNVSWIRSGVRQCDVQGVAPFVKQFGAHVRWNGNAPAGGWWPDGVRAEEAYGDPMHGAFRVHLRDRKGGDMAEWPTDLRRRDFPKVAA